MPIIINDSIRSNAPRSLDGKYLKGGSAPYTSIADALSDIPAAYRTLGLTVLVNTGGLVAEYWWRDGVQDIHLVEKVPAALPQSSVSGLPEALATKAPINSPTFTGTPSAPTPLSADNSTKIATTSFVKTAIANASIPGGGGTTSGVSSVNDMTGVVTITKESIGLSNVNNVADLDKPISALQQAAFNTKAPIASPIFTGNPTAPTPIAGTNNTQVATTAFVTAAITAAKPTIDSTPTASSTNAVQSGGVATALALKAPLASPALTGTPTAPTPGPFSASAQIATKGYVDTVDNTKANLDAPVFTGVPIAPTAAVGTNTTQIATTEFVQLALANVTPTISTDATPTSGSTKPVQSGGVFTALAAKASLAGPAFTGAPTAPTPATGTNTTQIATTAFVASAIASKANLASPAFTGTPTAPTPVTSDSTTKVATTAYVKAAIAANVQADAGIQVFTSIPTGTFGVDFFAGDVVIL